MPCVEGPASSSSASAHIPKPTENQASSCTRPVRFSRLDYKLSLSFMSLCLPFNVVVVLVFWLVVRGSSDQP